MRFLSCMCIEDVSEVLFLVGLLIRPTLCCCHSKSIVVTHIKTDQRLGRFDDLLILAARHAGQNVSAVFWPRCCHTMPPQGSVMGGQVWPQWKSLSFAVFPTSTAEERLCTGVQCVRFGSERHKQDVACASPHQDKTKGCDYFVTWHRHAASLTTWRWPCYHFPLLDPFVNISVYSWCGGVNIKLYFPCKQTRSATKGSGTNIYTQDVCLCPAETVTCPSSGGFDKLVLACRCSFIRALSKNNGSNNNSEVKVRQFSCTVTKSAAGSIWRPPLSPGWNRLKHKHTEIHFKNGTFWAAPPCRYLIYQRGCFLLRFKIAIFNKSVQLQCSIV